MHLFAGAGGGILGDILCGHVPVCAVEYDSYARNVLLARQRDGCLPRFPIWDEVRTFSGVEWRGHVDVVAGGFPCQDISSAGRGAGITGPKSGLWSHMARIIGEVRPRFAFVENSPVLTSRGLGTVLGDLAALGYDARWGVLGAHHAGAPHKRDRIWILADAGHLQGWGWSEPEETEGAKASIGSHVGNPEFSGLEGSYDNAKSPERIQCEPVQSGDEMANAIRERQPGSRESWYSVDPAESREGETDHAFHERLQRVWGLESQLGRVAHGVAHRVDRLRCIGNGQVPAVAKLAWHTLLTDLCPSTP